MNDEKHLASRARYERVEARIKDGEATKEACAAEGVSVGNLYVYRSNLRAKGLLPKLAWRKGKPGRPKKNPLSTVPAPLALRTKQQHAQLARQKAAFVDLVKNPIRDVTPESIQQDQVVVVICKPSQLKTILGEI